MQLPVFSVLKMEDNKNWGEMGGVEKGSTWAEKSIIQPEWFLKGVPNACLALYKLLDAQRYPKFAEILTWLIFWQPCIVSSFSAWGPVMQVTNKQFWLMHKISDIKPGYLTSRNAEEHAWRRTPQKLKRVVVILLPYVLLASSGTSWAGLDAFFLLAFNWFFLHGLVQLLLNACIVFS